ncbi:PQQ-dependent sugar dehydrogenase [Tsukamurella sp. 8F]|uniref:PQQ-dependent sugar dehydrogenase n=1 Tax=unclassified Tsukamurella TaxID=2633480 RepID=UPI0023B90928|nr:MULTISPECIES: PQQ-dependent sugar dehydrogenase [unclassified Tsukamurella]MDF0528613.1 PQQ-dependent sugar dehydrogenase [Tsukamurella sp. 8J]MDF0585575.1 PQQ-dependent sugar dehydrogenase [Tsukamurella sp. 8F]
MPARAAAMAVLIAVAASACGNRGAQWAPDEACPSGMAAVGGTLYLANLRGERLRTIPIADPSRATELFVGRYGRIRDAAAGPDGSVWIVTNNTDGRGSPRAGNDRILRIAR